MNKIQDNGTLVLGIHKIKSYKLVLLECKNGCRYDGSEEYDHGFEQGWNRAIDKIISELVNLAK